VLTIIAGVLSFLTAIINLFAIAMWVGYICIVTLAVKYLYTDKYPTKAKPVTSAVIGTIVGSSFNWILGITSSMFSIFGIALAIGGTILYIRIYERRNNGLSL